MSHSITIPTPFARRVGLLTLGLATLLPMLAGSMANMVLPALGQVFAVPFAACIRCRWRNCPTPAATVSR